jgi:hypothetical protein
MSDPGKVNHYLHVFKQRAPFDRARQIRDRNHFNRPRKYIRRLPHSRPHGVSHIGQFGDQGASDKARCAGHEDTRHNLPRVKTNTRRLKMS